MPRTGRPRAFDREHALLQAMRLFWAHGYESTSISDLKAAMGDISSASFYAAFGSKESLFEQVVDRYLATHGQVTAPLRDPEAKPREAIERTLRQSARMQTDNSHPLGCLVALSTATCAAQNAHIQILLAARRANDRAALENCVCRAVASGELPSGTDVTALATVFSTFLFGLSIQARDGVSLETLDLAITQLVAIWGRSKRASRPRVANKANSTGARSSAAFASKRSGLSGR